MAAEHDRDSSTGSVHHSTVLNATGRARWSTILREAIDHGNPEQLAHKLQYGMLKTENVSHTGHSYRVNARFYSNMIGESEFNRYYIRAVCLLAIERGIEHVVVYRAKQVDSPRPESERLRGKRIRAVDLLDDLRRNIGRETEYGVPKPNSGLSVRLP